MATLDFATVSSDQGMSIAEAALELLLRSGMIRDDVVLSGPELLLCMSGLAESMDDDRQASGLMPADLVEELLDTSAESLGDILFAVAVDRGLLARTSLVDAVRTHMRPIETPAILAQEVSFTPDWLSDKEPIVRSFSASDDRFTITFSRFPSEGGSECWIVVQNAVLKSRNVGRQPFSRITPSA